MGHPAVMAARDFSGAASGKVTFTPAGITGVLILAKFSFLVSEDAVGM